MTTQQKALLLKDKQGRFAIEAIPIPTPGANELLVKIESAALNPVDWKVPEYGIIREDYPVILGYDAAGTVEEVGPEVQGFAKGDKVFYQAGPTNEYGAFQQYALAKANVTAKLPGNITFDEATSIPSGITTATLGLFTHNINLDGAELYPFWEEGGRGKYSGRPIVIFGGSSCVGQFTIQVAKLSGFSPIITTASLRNADMLKELGATHVLDRNLSTDALSEEIAKITSKPLEIVYDAISLPVTQNAAFDITAPGGYLVLVLSEAIDPAKKASQPKHVIVHLGATGPGYEASNSVWTTLTELVEEGVIQPMRVQILSGGLAGILEGLDLLKKDKVSAAKLVVHPQETA
ncbi:hypothetical protein CERSUDRAFT_151111 [Gelatoporia subvermispora B]|uniref:Enoyl reductase (ER) domain-containing protein n=1 Tax=Ceriporiopsis subvermispora (strain B) TaxID=914234 RepID=M2RNW2_CERS8|nr:hypothetical protein CERSUDRAFT_151111 [Gelatoporia subvermispora B]